ncbi:MAG: hypothetical protein ABI972_06260 [Acidobacteriota bacterium]
MLRRSLLMASAARAASASFRVSTFRCEITPAVGAPIYTGTAASIVDPLEAHGIVLSGGEKPVVIVALDWCEVRNRSYDLWRSTLAAAARTAPERVLLSCVHPHDAPYTDLEAQQLLDSVKSPHALCDTAFERACMKKVAGAIRSAPSQAVTHIGTGQAPVRDVASNRRYVLPGGKVSFGRTSATRDPGVRAQPEGLIDPSLKVISFWNEAKPVAALHVYSTHPMSHYGQGNVSADFPGIARRRMQADLPGVFTMYCSGASGDTMAGRYNDGSPANRTVLAGRLHEAMSAAWRSTERVPISSLRFRSARLVFQPRKDERYTLTAMRELLESPATPRRERLDAALGISWLRRLGRRQPIDVPALHLGSAKLLLVPAEAFVQYQLWAQQASPTEMVLTLGYGECAPGYIPTNASVAEGYDDHYSWVDFGTCERDLRRAVQDALAG